MLSDDSLLLSPSTPEKLDNFYCDETSLTKTIKIPFLMIDETLKENSLVKKSKDMNNIQ